MTYTKKVLKDELDDCTKEFSRQLNELNLKIKNLSHKYVVLKNSKMENNDREDKYISLLEQTKQRY
jgi:Cft2 family RNA processing exonuclease